MTVEEVASAEVLEVRGRVLREGRPHEGFAEDDEPGTFHLAVRVDGVVVGAASFIPGDPGEWQLRGMAVDADRQGQGVGRVLLEAGVERARAAGGHRLWANGRDTALGFYQRLGWRVVGDGFLLGEGRPHHRIELDL